MAESAPTDKNGDELGFHCESWGRRVWKCETQCDKCFRHQHADLPFGFRDELIGLLERWERGSLEVEVFTKKIEGVLKALRSTRAAAPSSVAPIVKPEVVLKDCLVGGDEGVGFHVWLKIGNQSFPIGNAFESKEKEEAEWSARMLREALERCALSATSPRNWRLDEIVNHVLDDLFQNRGLRYPMSHSDMRLCLRSAELYLESAAYVARSEGRDANG